MTSSQRLSAFRAGLDPREVSLLESEREASSAALASVQAQPKQVLNAASAAAALADGIHKRRLQVLPPAVRLACHEGCHWCCYMKVTASAAEVLLIAQHLTTTRSPAELARVKARIRELARDPRIFSSDEKPRARIACALLSSEGACTAYAVRPLACRGWNSLDADACRRSLDDDNAAPEMDVRLARDAAVVGIGLLDGLHAAGLPSELIELTAGLAVALNEPRALQRWVLGEPLFAEAQSEPDEG